MLRFGTDGVRGNADTDLSTPLVVALGRAAARVIGAPEFVVGRDTRESGPRIEADLIRGLTADGARVRSLGVASTPAVAFVAQRVDLPAAIVSASHNPWSDNGVKLLSRDGRKLAPDIEAEIETQAGVLFDPALTGPAVASRQSTAVPDPEADLDLYVRHLLSAARGPNARRPARHRRLRERRRVRARPACACRGRGSRRCDQRPARRSQHQRRLRIDVPGGPSACRRRTQRQPRSPHLTVTPTVWSRSTNAEISSTATKSW